MEALMIVGALMSIFVWAGLLLIVAGLSRSKNAASAMLRGLAALFTAILAFYLLGNPLAMQQNNAVIGFNLRAFHAGMDVQGLLYLSSMLPATVLLVGTLHERSRFAVIPVLAGGLCGVVIPIAMQWIWRGWLTRLGCLDIGGAATVWLPAAVFALAAAWFVGPRQGKYNTDGSANGIVGHNIPLAFAGVAILLVGWLASSWSHAWLLPASLGWVLPSSVTNPLLAGAAGGLAAMIFAYRKYGKAEAYLTIVGLLSGMMSVSSIGGLLPPWAAIIAGAVASWLALWSTIRLDVRLRIDDPISAITTFGVSAMVAMVVPAFVVQGNFLAMSRQLGVQLLAVLVVLVFTGAVSVLLLLGMKKLGSLRSKEADEYDGLDLAEHDVNAYPDFQQTMIKSYHLREA